MLILKILHQNLHYIYLSKPFYPTFEYYLATPYLLPYVCTYKTIRCVAPCTRPSSQTRSYLNQLMLTTPALSFLTGVSTLSVCCPTLPVLTQFIYPGSLIQKYPCCLLWVRSSIHYKLPILYLRGFFF